MSARRIPRATADHAVRAIGVLTVPTVDGQHDPRSVLIHPINETARHAGHADILRELIDGVTGE